MSTSLTSTGDVGGPLTDEPVVIGRIGRPHGVRGDVTIDVRTDVPDRRFATGTKINCDPPTATPLVVAGSRWHSGRLLVRFEGVGDRTAAEALRGRVLTISPGDVGPAGEDGDEEDSGDLWWDRDLVGLRVLTRDGVDVGVVVDVVHTPAGELLAIGLTDDRETGETRETGEVREVLVPFVREIVPTVNLSDRRIVVDPPPGLFDLE
ncbi:ribosome maturation factor RimM [Frankia sp. Cppng1_Ct_nod]|uniref:ribosome maturation factor RimM n=1 Tax=Frankia sp. Cppng1_Ct_nod TaxID=2897162 RepID=UPI001F5EF700|nr:ribosome maturation factor RimM [Frankia sp. Cppng1_Ct_nod]